MSPSGKVKHVNNPSFWEHFISKILAKNRPPVPAAKNIPYIAYPIIGSGINSSVLFWEE
jgi:hypothetical protein